MNTSILRKIEVTTEDGKSFKGFVDDNHYFWKDGKTMYSCRCDGRFLAKRDHIECESCGRKLQIKLDKIQQHINDTYKIFDALNK